MKVMTVILLMALSLTGQEAMAIDVNQWKNMAPVQKSLYVHGVVDTWGTMAAVQQRTSEVLNKPDANKDFPNGVLAASEPERNLHKCVTKGEAPASHIIAIIDKYVAAHPEHWHNNTMATIIGVALTDFCNEEMAK
jgi:hypothetical protein